MDTVHECDRRMDRQTDGQTDRITITKTVQRIASHSKKYHDKRTITTEHTGTTDNRPTVYRLA